MLRSSALALLVVIAAACASSSGEQAAGVDASWIDGGTLYLRHCGGCHGAKGTAQQAESLPAIDVMTRDQLEEKILHGGVDMPTFASSLSDDDLDRILDYLTD